MIYLDSSMASPDLLAEVAIRRTRCGISPSFQAGCSNTKSGPGSTRVGFSTRMAMRSAL